MQTKVATHWTAKSALSSARTVKNALIRTQIWAGIPFNTAELRGLRQNFSGLFPTSKSIRLRFYQLYQLVQTPVLQTEVFARVLRASPRHSF